MNLYGIETTNLIAWTVIGILASTMIETVDKGDVQSGLGTTLITGILGSLVGGFLSSILLGLSLEVVSIPSILIAAAGALILIIVQRTFLREDKHIRTRTEQLSK